MGATKIDETVKDKLKTLSTKIEEQTTVLINNNEAFITKGNKQAAKRARVASLNISKATKEYRAISMSTSKS